MSRACGIWFRTLYWGCSTAGVLQVGSNCKARKSQKERVEVSPGLLIFVAYMEYAHIWTCSAVRKMWYYVVFVSFSPKGTFCEFGSLQQDTRRKFLTVSRWWEHRWTKFSLWRSDSNVSSYSSSLRPCSPLPLYVRTTVLECSTWTRDRQLLWGSWQQEETPCHQQWEVAKSF